MSVIKMTIPLPPSVNSLYQNQAFFNTATRKYESTGKRILSKEGRKVKEQIKEKGISVSKEYGWDKDNFDETFLYMDADVFFNRKGRDADNIYKAIQDSLQGVIYNNDSQVLARTQRIYFDKENPRVELTIYPVDFVGIFNNKDYLNQFMENCGNCSKYRNGSCSILKDSISGVVREEIGDIDNPVCSKYKEKKK